MKTWLTAPFLALFLMAGPAQAQVAATPSLELIGPLSKALGSTQEQAAGAAGALFAAAKTKMTPEDWSKMEKAVPGLDEMMQKVPERPTAGPAAEAEAAYGIRGTSSLQGAFARLGLDPNQVSTAAPIVRDYVTQVAGPDVGKALVTAMTP